MKRQKIIQASCRGTLYIGACMLVLAAPAQTVVEFESDKLYREIVEALGLAPGSEVLDTDMLRLTELRSIYYSTGDDPIGSLVGLEFARNIEILELPGNDVTDLSPLSGLNQITTLNLAYNPISDLGPLASIDLLIELDLQGCKQLDFTKLALFTRLHALDLDETGVSDLSFLTGYTELRSLTAKNGSIEQTSPLASMTKLELLDLSGNPITSLSDLAYLDHLDDLLLNRVQVEDWSLISRMTTLAGLALDENDLIQIDFLSTLINLEHLSLADNQIEDISPLAGKNALVDLTLDNNRIVDLSPVYLNGTWPTRIQVSHNNLDAHSLCEYIPAMYAAGSTVFVSSGDHAGFYTAGKFDAACAEPNRDNDGDGLTNLEEANFGTKIDEADTDGDGVSDGDEVDSGYNPNNWIEYPGGIPANVPDAYLEQAIRDTLDMGDHPLYEQHLKLLRSLEIRSWGISSLEGLQHAVNLNSIEVQGGHISDLTPISKLPRLRWLTLPFNQIVDVPDLSNLKSLKGLDLSGNPLANIEFAKTLPDIWILHLNGCGIKDIAPLESLSALMELGLAENEIEDIAPLRGVAIAFTIDLSYNQVRDISPLSGNVLLQELYLGGNEISEVGAIRSLRLLRILVLADNRIERMPRWPGLKFCVELYASNNLLENIDFVRGTNSLGTLYLDGNRISDLRPLSNVENLRYLNFEDNQIADATPLSTLFPKIKWLQLSSNQLTSLDALQYLWQSPITESVSRNPIPEIEFDELAERHKDGYGDPDAPPFIPVPDDLREIYTNSAGDVDGDGLSNYDEVLKGGEIKNPDSDFDGFTDGEEVAAGSYPWHQDSIPIENPNTTPLPEKASILLAQYDTITTAPNRARLFYDDCQVTLPGMTYQDFEALDENGSDGLSVWELELHAPKDTGCNLTEDGGAKSTTPQQGDLTLVGMTLAAMTLVRHRHDRNSDTT